MTLSSAMDCSAIVGSILFLLNHYLVILSIPCMGRFTYRSFMSKVIILWWLLIWILVRSCATCFEFFLSMYMVNLLVHTVTATKSGKLMWWSLYA